MAKSRGVAVLLAGPDGVGKSSLGRALKDHFSEREVRIYWQRPGVLPRKTSDGKRDRSRPHAAPSYGTFVSFVKVVYVFLDVLLGWAFRVYPARRAGAILIIERGWWDMLVDPRRYRLRGSDWLIRVLGILVPAPDVTLVLVGDPDLVAGRRAHEELPIDELARQMLVWREVLPRRARVLYLDIDAPLTDVVERAIVNVTESLEG